MGFLSFDRITKYYILFIRLNYTLLRVQKYLSYVNFILEIRYSFLGGCYTFFSFFRNFESLFRFISLLRDTDNYLSMLFESISPCHKNGILIQNAIMIYQQKILTGVSKIKFKNEQASEYFRSNSVRTKAQTRNYEEKFSYSSYAFLVNRNYTMSCCVIVSTCHLFDREYVSFRRKRQPVPRFIFLLRAIHFCFLFRSSLSFPRSFLLVSLLEPARYKRMHFAARNHLEAITTESNSLARPVHLFNRCTKHFSEIVTLKRRKHFSLHGIVVYQVIGPWRIQG